MGCSASDDRVEQLRVARITGRAGLQWMVDALEGYAGGAHRRRRQKGAVGLAEEVVILNQCAAVGAVIGPVGPLGTLAEGEAIACRFGLQAPPDFLGQVLHIKKEGAPFRSLPAVVDHFVPIDIPVEREGLMLRRQSEGDELRRGAAATTLPRRTGDPIASGTDVDACFRA